MRNVVITAVLALAAAAPAQAQVRWEDRGYINLSGAIQAPSHDVTVNRAFTLYDQESTLEGRRKISAGALIDVSAGVRFWDNLALGIGYSRFSDASGMDVTARVPDPLVFDNPNVQVIGSGGLDHTEQGIHLSAVWFWPVTDKIDVAFSAGPSIFSVEQETVTVNESNVVPLTSTLTGLTRIEESETTVGLNAGVDVTYLLTRRIGAGLLLRYAGASTDLAGSDVDVGGFQVGFGVRVRF